MTPQGHSLSILTPHPPHALGFLYYSWLLFFLNLHFLINSYFLDWISHCLSKNIYVPKTIANKKIIFFFLLETKRWNKNEKVACLDVILKPKDSYWSFPGALKPRSKRGLKWIYKTIYRPQTCHILPRLAKQSLRELSQMDKKQKVIQNYRDRSCTSGVTVSFSTSLVLKIHDMKIIRSHWKNLFQEVLGSQWSPSLVSYGNISSNLTHAAWN